MRRVRFYDGERHVVSVGAQSRGGLYPDVFRRALRPRLTGVRYRMLRRFRCDFWKPAVCR